MPDPTPIAEVIQSIYPPCKESPLCCYPPLQSGYCFRHEPRKEKVKKRINPVSEKRKKQAKEYRAIVKEMLNDNDQCEIKAPGCTGKAQGLDHVQKRSPKNLLERANLKRACNNCNLFKELNPTWSKENGHEKSRFKK